MEALDGDDVRLTSSRGQRAARDIVQFVPMREVVARGGGPQALAKEVRLLSCMPFIYCILQVCNIKLRLAIVQFVLMREVVARGGGPQALAKEVRLLSCMS
jgi:Copine